MATPSALRNNQVIAQDSVLELLKLIGTCKSNQIFNEIIDGQVPNLDIDMFYYSDAYTYNLDAQAIALVKKCGYHDFGIDTKKATLDVWYESEKQCSEYNRLLTTPSYLRDFSKNATGIIYTARKYLAKLLGPVPECDAVRFGPGSTAHSRGFKGSLPNKLESDSGLYSHTHPMYAHKLFTNNKMFLASMWTDRDGQAIEVKFNKIDHDVFDIVPKNYKVGRGISYGASLNMVLQLNVHDHIVRRLTRWGIDLAHLPDYHKELARKGSIDDSLATIDLSAASDSICTELVRALLPYEWFAYLDNIRARSTKIDDQVIALEKFCAMGCGFTFVLETIIFMSIAWATAQIEGHVINVMSVFGDDIIVDSDIAEQVVFNLSVLGFKTNQDKTFLSGPFRESCGGDYFNGISVRPIYWKEIPDGIEGLYVIANRLRQTLRALNLNDYCRLDGKYIWENVIELIPENFRFFGPASCGDRVITSCREEWIGYSRYRDQQLRVSCIGRAYELKNRARPRKRYGKLAFALYKLGMSEHNQGLFERKLSASIQDQSQIMKSTNYKVVKRNAFVYYTVDDESYSWI